MSYADAETVILQPRPYAQRAGRLLLVPLLSSNKSVRTLPPEVWSDILVFAASEVNPGVTAWILSCATICKFFKDLALPILYSNVEICHVETLEKFFERLYLADQKWDSIRRIPYSTPGRWVQLLDLSRLVCQGSKEALLADYLLTQIFPLMPFLQRFFINPYFIVSRRVLNSIANREGSVNIRTLRGFSYIQPMSSIPDEDPFVQLLRHCPGIEELDLIGQGIKSYEPDELAFPNSSPDGSDAQEHLSFSPLTLPNLRDLSIVSIHSSPLLSALLHSPLPNLRKLQITPYDDIPYPLALTSRFIATHGKSLRSLLLYTPCVWPTRLHPSPSNLLELAPQLRHLSLERPLPRLSQTDNHPLEILSIPRPDAESLSTIEKALPYLPHLHIVRTRDVKWLKKGLSSMAQQAGVQGEMKRWQTRMMRRGIRVLDGDWNDCE